MWSDRKFVRQAPSGRSLVLSAELTRFRLRWNPLSVVLPGTTVLLRYSAELIKTPYNLTRVHLFNLVMRFEYISNRNSRDGDRWWSSICNLNKENRTNHIKMDSKVIFLLFQNRWTGTNILFDITVFLN